MSRAMARDSTTIANAPTAVHNQPRGALAVLVRSRLTASGRDKGWTFFWDGSEQPTWLGSYPWTGETAHA
ncbi:hypothetical protein GCM10028820_08220 [Tessaracoccus terricola]